MVVTDLAKRDRTAVREHLPNACELADRCDVVRNFAKVLVSARRDARTHVRGRPYDSNVFGHAPGRRSVS